MPFVRNLTLSGDQGVHDVPVSVAEPQESGGTWTCQYEIAWPEGSSIGRIGGADAIQAIYLTMQAVALALYASPHHRAGRLYWHKPGEGYGFPMPKAGYADLVGDDRASQV